MELARKRSLSEATWDDLTTPQPLDTMTTVEVADDTALGEGQRAFLETGAVALSGLIPDDLLAHYERVRAELPKDKSAPDNFWGGWHYPTPFMKCPALLNLATYPQLQMVMQSLIGEPVGLHLALTGWVSTERAWHQDTYLNPDYLWSHYIAAWIALDDVHEDAGPFEFVKGSHRWPSLRRERLFAFLTRDEQLSPHWPTTTQGDVARVCEAEMKRRGATVTRFIPKRGDVLFWHSNLLHRGSPPRDPNRLRKALICHYSSLTRRLDMSRIARNPVNGSLYFDLPSDSAARMT